MNRVHLTDFKPAHLRIASVSSPVALYEALYKGEDYGFIYESLEDVEKRGRYSFIGGRPYLVMQSRKDRMDVQCLGKRFRQRGNPMAVLKQWIHSVREYPQVKPFPGGALGYISYDAVRLFESIPDTNPEEVSTPETFFMFPGEILVFDHLENTIDILVFTQTNAQLRMEELKAAIQSNPTALDFRLKKASEERVRFRSNVTEASFCRRIRRAKEYIRAGDIFQVVLSQRFTFPVNSDPFTIFRALRVTNPSPYMYWLNRKELHILGSSPEILVKNTGSEAITRPLAGTRPRGQTRREDEEYARELLKDEKERAEHVMLVDLARNDLGRVCRAGSVETTQLLEIEKYSKVMHLVSNVRGQLLPEKDAFDLLASSFPAGTVSGAPKIRAMEIIDELESVRRGIYAGAIGYFGFNGDMDMCIAIRMIVIKKHTGMIQAGAGIVADSDPNKEYQETLNKAQALLNAINSVEEQV